jgi:predicted nucleic acid-binding protein
MFVLDTDVVIHLRDKEPGVTAKVAELDGPVVLSIVSRIELENGVQRDPAQSAARRSRVDTILSTLDVMPFDEASADAYRRIIEAAGYSRRKLLDRMIAAQALVHRATLVTLNGADFRDVPGLHLLEW